MTTAVLSLGGASIQGDHHSMRAVSRIKLRKDSLQVALDRVRKRIKETIQRSAIPASAHRTLNQELWTKEGWMASRDGRFSRTNSLTTGSPTIQK
jgi:hypothetical protein